MDARGNLAQQGGGNLLVRGVLCEVDGDEELLRLGVDIANINTTLVGEEDPVALIGKSAVVTCLERCACWRVGGPGRSTS